MAFFYKCFNSHRQPKGVDTNKIQTSLKICERNAIANEKKAICKLKDKINDLMILLNRVIEKNIK